MIALFLMVQAAAAPLPAAPLPGALPRQTLPAKGCAAYLWSVEDRRFVAMAGSEPGSLRLAIDGKAVDLARVGQEGSAGFGFGDSVVYRQGELTVTLALRVQTRAELSDGAMVPAASLSIVRSGGGAAGGGDTLVLPVAGLIGCAKSTMP